MSPLMVDNNVHNSTMGWLLMMLLMLWPLLTVLYLSVVVNGWIDLFECWWYSTNDIDDVDDDDDDADDSLWNLVWIIRTMTDRNYDMDNNVDLY